MLVTFTRETQGSTIATPPTMPDDSPDTFAPTLRIARIVSSQKVWPLTSTSALVDTLPRVDFDLPSTGFRLPDSRTEASEKSSKPQLPGKTTDLDREMDLIEHDVSDQP